MSDTDPATSEITALLHGQAAGDAAALEQLLPRYRLVAKGHYVIAADGTVTVSRDTLRTECR